MDIFVDSINTNFCEPLPEHPVRKSKSEAIKRKDSCLVDLYYTDNANGLVGLLTLKRGDPDQDIFVAAPRKDPQLMVPILRDRDRAFPQLQIRKAIYLRSFIRVENFDEVIVTDEAFDDFFTDFITFGLFGEITQADPQKFNGQLNQRLIREIHQLQLKYPQQWYDVEDFIKTLQRDPKLSIEEKGRLQWLLDVARTLHAFEARFPQSKTVPGVEAALLQTALYLFSPNFNWEDLPKDPLLKSAAVALGGRDPTDFFQDLTTAMEQELPKIDSIQNNLVLLARYNRLLLQTKQAVDEKWTYLFNLESPDRAFKEGLRIKYAKTALEEEVLKIFNDNLTVAYEGSEKRPHFFLGMDRIFQGIVALAEDPKRDPEQRSRIVRFVSEVILGKFLAQDVNIEVFVDGHFQERVNFYPILSLSTQRPSWSKLIDWTRGNIRQKSLVTPEPHVLWNKSGFFFADLPLVALGSVGAALLWEDRGWRTASMGTAGAGLGGALGNLSCYLLDLSNRYYQCDILGGLLGGAATALLSFFLSPGERPPPEPPAPPPMPDPGQRNPTDPFGP